MSEWLRDALGLAPGETPFPWQEDLLTSFLGGNIPTALDIPTGLGKTAVMAIWLVTRAMGAIASSKRSKGDVDVFGCSELAPRLRLLSPSAPGRNVEGALELTAADLEHPIVQKQLGAPKHQPVRTLDDEEKLAEALADEAWELTENGGTPARCIVSCDKREDAQRALEGIAKRSKGDRDVDIPPVDVCTELFVGGRELGWDTGKYTQKFRDGRTWNASTPE
jgi:hypothetical protein